MKLYKKKAMLSIGSIAAIVAPIVTVISCSDQSVSTQDSKYTAMVKSDQSKAILEQTWLEKVIVEIKGQTMTPEQISNLLVMPFKIHISNSLSSDPFYITKLVQDTKEKSGTVPPNGINEVTFTSNEINSFISNSTNVTNLMNYLFDKDSDGTYLGINLRNKLLKNYVAYSYLNLSKDEWAKVFDKDGDIIKGTNVETIIDPTNFTFIKELVDKHYYATFSSNPKGYGVFIGKTESTIEAPFTDSTNFTLLEQNTKTVGSQENMIISSSHLKDFYGFTGFKSMSFTNHPTSTIADWKTTTDVLIKGAVKNDKLVESNVEWFMNDTTKPSMQIAYSMLPYFHGGILTHQHAGANDNIGDLMKTWMVEWNSGIYDQAVKYWTEKTNPIQIEILNSSAKEIYQDAGFKFIK